MVVKHILGVVLIFLFSGMMCSAQNGPSTKNSIKDKGLGITANAVKLYNFSTIELNARYNRLQANVGIGTYQSIWNFNFQNINHNIPIYTTSLDYFYRIRKNQFYVSAGYLNWKWLNNPSTEPSNYNRSFSDASYYAKEKNQCFSLDLGANIRLMKYVYLNASAGWMMKITESNAASLTVPFTQNSPVFQPKFDFGLRFLMTERERNAKSKEELKVPFNER